MARSKYRCCVGCRHNVPCRENNAWDLCGKWVVCNLAVKTLLRITEWFY